MHIYLPIAGIAVSALLLVGLGGLVGFLSGLFGVGGGFLMTPLLIMMGIPATIAAASDSNQIVAASASGRYAHFREGNVDLKMGALMLVSGVVGGTVGVRLIQVLRGLGEADFVITVVYAVMFGGIGSYMFFESLRALRPQALAPAPAASRPTPPRRGVALEGALPSIEGDGLGGHAPRLGLLVGVLAAVMGVGGASSWFRSWLTRCGCQCTWWWGRACSRSCSPAPTSRSCRPP